MINERATIEWFSGGRKATQKPNPAFPNGIEVGAVGTPLKHCRIALPYPAPEVGAYGITCTECGQRTLVTAAGRADDPVAVTVICRGRDGA